MIFAFTDSRNPDSLASRLRLKRNQLFLSLVKDMRPISILDVGGLPPVWERLSLVDQPGVSITLLNTSAVADQCKTSYRNLVGVVGDARDLQAFEDGQFDVVYSNSVIEHVGDLEDMRRMADEMRRVGKRYFLQTPNRYFPVEPHFVFPFFQFLPLPVQMALVRHFSLGWFRKTPDRAEAEEIVRGIRLLSKKEVLALFPDGKLVEEKFGGLVKSWIIYKA